MTTHFTKTLSLFIIFLTITIGFYLYRYAIVSPYRLSSEKAKQYIKNKDIDLILDVRTDFERNALGYYPGSIHIQNYDLDTQMNTMFPNKNINIIVYCNTGHRARMATDKLQSLGYINSRFISSSYTTLM